MKERREVNKREERRKQDGSGGGEVKMGVGEKREERKQEMIKNTRYGKRTDDEKRGEVNRKRERSGNKWTEGKEMRGGNKGGEVERGE